MKYLNNWFSRYLVIFIFTSIILYGVYYYFYPEEDPNDRYYYTQYSTDAYHYFIKIDKTTGDVYRFSTNSSSGREWELLNK